MAHTIEDANRRRSVSPRGGRVLRQARRLLQSEISTVAASKASIVAVYPGSFDPITNGHLDLIARGSRLVDRLIVAILGNESKKSLFTVAERVEMLEEVVKPYPNVEVGSFDGLRWTTRRQRGANMILRGIRAISDYEYELQMALMNRRLQPGRRNGVSDGGRGVSRLSVRTW